jgi:hypothetical protein
LPEPLASLVRQILAARRGHAAIGDDGTLAWQRASSGDWAAYAADVSRRAST